MKWFSRKFFMSILVICITIILKSKNLIGDWPAVCLILVSASVYMLVNGAIKIEYLKINQKNFEVMIRDEEENQDEEEEK